MRPTVKGIRDMIHLIGLEAAIAMLAASCVTVSLCDPLPETLTLSLGLGDVLGLEKLYGTD
jgi:hypothetical protein